MTVRRAVAAALGCLLAAALARAADSPVGRVVAEVIPLDLKALDPEYVKSLMHTKPGKAYDPATVNHDVQRLHNTSLFVRNSVVVSTALTADGRVTVFVKLQELTGVAREVVYLGAQHYSDTELGDLTGLRRGGPMNPASNQLARQAILNKLRDDGRLYASVDMTEGGKATDTRVVFAIVEGPVVRVRAVRFAGNEQASSGRLATQVVTSSALIPGVVTALTAKYNPGTIEEDHKRLVTYYRRMGYLDASVRHEVVRVGSGAAVDIVYHVHEGRPYTVNQVRIEGSKTVPPETLRQVTAVKVGEAYNIDVVQADEKRIEARCGNGGHKTYVAHEYLAVPDKPGVVDVVYRVEQRTAEPDRVGRIIVRGNTVTDQRVILNQLGLFPGQILRYPQLEVARANLIRLNLFSQEDPPTVVEAPNQFDSVYKDIIVTVKETSTGMFAVQANVNSDAGINGSIVLNQRNFDITRVPTSFDDLLSGKAFLGGGQELRVEAMPGTQFQRYAVTFREPYLGDTRFGLTASGYYFTRVYREYDEQRLGIRGVLDYRLDNPNWRVNGSVRVEDVLATRGRQFVPTPQQPFDYAPRSITDDLGHSTLVGLRAGVTRDTRDSYLLPTSGSVIDFGFEQVLGDYSFPIGTFEASSYYTVWQRKDGSGKHVLSSRTQLTVMGENAPVFERLYAGGIRSFRGFTFRGIGPYENGLNVGGTFGFLNSHEYQIPVLASDKLWFAAFVDHGTVERDVRIDQYRVSAGVGLRIQVAALGPLPIALDFGFPLRRGPFDDKQVFNFYMGWGIGS